MLQEKTELSTFLGYRGIQFDISLKIMCVNGKPYDIDYEKYKDLDKVSQKKESLHKNRYGTIHRVPEFLLTLSDFSGGTARNL